jgi:methylenetetrahydrofolate dehydrogenase (NADP+) / methenyltetrahydrofolate cyclohydrolase
LQGKIDFLGKIYLYYNVIYNNLPLKSEFKKYLESETNAVVPKLKLNIIQIGNDLASTKYVGIKRKIGTDLNIDVKAYNYDINTTLSVISEVLSSSTFEKEGLIFQLPVPESVKSLVSQTSLACDVDLLGDKAQKLWHHNFLPPTIGAIDLVLKDILWTDRRLDDKLTSKLDLSGKIVVIIGQGVLVGGPLLQYLKDRLATIISLNKFTRNAQDLCKTGDIVISAAGSPNLVNTDWIKDNSILIDASTSEENGALVGDVDPHNLTENIILCPSPGGIGPLTVLYLFYNLLKLRNLDIK